MRSCAWLLCAFAVAASALPLVRDGGVAGGRLEAADAAGAAGAHEATLPACGSGNVKPPAGWPADLTEIAERALLVEQMKYARSCLPDTVHPLQRNGPDGYDEIQERPWDDRYNSVSSSESSSPTSRKKNAPRMDVYAPTTVVLAAVASVRKSDQSPGRFKTAGAVDWTAKTTKVRTLVVTADLSLAEPAEKIITPRELVRTIANVHPRPACHAPDVATHGVVNRLSPEYSHREFIRSEFGAELSGGNTNGCVAQALLARGFFFYQKMPEGATTAVFNGLAVHESWSAIGDARRLEAGTPSR